MEKRLAACFRTGPDRGAMQLASYNIRGRTSFGVVVGDGIVDLRPRMAPRYASVLDLIRGKDVNRALATLKFTRKGIAGDVAKLVRSAVANAQNREGFSGDVQTETRR